MKPEISITENRIEIRYTGEKKGCYISTSLDSFYDRLFEMEDRLDDKIDILEAENKSMRDVLQFYADSDSYRSKCGGHIENKNFHSGIGRDCGRRAKAVLLKCEVPSNAS